MTTQERQTKVADMIKNADLYDLIRISMRSSDNKVSAVDRYIKRALDRQINHQVAVIDCDESIMTTLNDNNNLLRTQDTNHQKTLSNVTEQYVVDSPIKENRVYYNKSSRQSPSPVKSTCSVGNSTIMHSPQKRNPLDENNVLSSVNLNDTMKHLIQMSPPTKISQQALSCKENSPYKEQASLIISEKYLKQDNQPVLEDQTPPSPKKDLPPTPTSCNELLVHYPVQDQTYVSCVSQDLQDLQNQWPQKNDISQARPQSSQSRYQQQTQSSQNRQRSFIEEDNKVQPQKGIFVYQNSNRPSIYNTQNKGLGRSISTNALDKDQSYYKKQNDIISPARGNTSRSNLQQHSSSGTKTNRLSSSNKSLLVIQDPTTASGEKSISHRDAKVDISNFNKHKKSTYDELVNKQVQKIASQFMKKPLSKKQKMINSFNMINLSLFVEIERIKKPQKHALQAGRMLCLLVSIFRDRPIKEDFNNWNYIQSFVNQNVNKFTQEVLGLKQKILDCSTLQYIDKLQKLNQEFFASNSLTTLQNHITNKHLKVIASFVHNVVCYILAKEAGKEDEPCFDEDISQINGHETYSEIGHPSQSSNTNDETPKAYRQGAYTNRQRDNSPIALKGVQPRDMAQIMNGVPQTTKSYTQKIKANVSPKPKNAHQKDLSPFRMPVKHKFIIPVKDEQKKTNCNYNILGTSQKQQTSRTKSKSITPVKEQKDKTAKPIVNKQSTQYDTTSQMAKRISQIETKQRDISNGSRHSIMPQTSRAQIQTQKRESQLFKSPISKVASSRPSSKSPSQQKLKSSKMFEQRVPQVAQKQEYQIKISDAEIEQSDDEIAQKQDSFQISPQRIKQAMRDQSELSQMIIQKSYQIEANMNTVENTMKKQIDLSIIEELKRRRAEQRVKGVELESKREEIISQVQRRMNNDQM